MLLNQWFLPPALLVEMSSSAFSQAQVFYDVGAGMSEEQSSTDNIRGDGTFQSIRLPLPNKLLLGLRFDPVTSPATVILRRLAIQRSDGSIALEFPPAHIQGTVGFDRMEIVPTGVLFHVRSDSTDPQLALHMDAPLDLHSRYPGAITVTRIALANLLLLALELTLAFRPAARARLRSCHTLVTAAAAKLSSPYFIQFDSLAIWFYVACFALFIALSAADLNGSSMGVFWSNFKVGAPPRILAGTSQEIRADEFDYQTPGMLHQYFREHPFALLDTPAGGHSVGLLAEIPVRHITTWVRPQFWPFWVLPADYAFATWWQAKWFILAVGVFTLFLLLTESSVLALTGTLWLLFSQLTQWDFSWPSMLPEMAGLLCLALVFAFYITVGRNKIALAACVLACASCAVNFALCSYIPHQIPYVLAALALLIAWCMARRELIFSPVALRSRGIALVACAALTGILMLAVFHTTSDAVAGIAQTLYPGHRSLPGGDIALTSFGTHFFAPFERHDRFPRYYANICEAAGFLGSHRSLCCASPPSALYLLAAAFTSPLFPPSRSSSSAGWSCPSRHPWAASCFSIE